jgi:micrococcal nuclease
MRRLTITMLAFALVACVAPVPPRSAPPRETQVVRVVDGDTIVVAIGGPRGTKVRLIGIDTPERDRCFFEAATQRMRALVEGKSVRLDKDVSETDRYGRLLRYVYSGTTFVNAVMVREGYATAATFPPDVAHANQFVALARVARIAKRGLWAGGCPK